MDLGPPKVQIPIFGDLSVPGGLVLGGLDRDKLLDRSLIAPDATHVTPGQHVLLMLNSIDMTGDEAHALGSGRLNRGFASLGLRTMLSTATLGPALDVLGRYFATCSSVFRIEVRRQHEVARVSLRAEGRNDARCEVLEEIWFNALYAFMCWFVGRRIPVMTATVARLDHPDAHRVHWAGNARLTKGEVSSLCFPLVCLQWPRTAVDVEEPVWEALRFWLDEDAAPPERSHAGLRPVFAVAEAPAKIKARQATSGRLVGDRQLSRRFRAEHGVGFRDLRNDALAQAATFMLRSTDTPIEIISARLGYAEERSFRRFLRGRTGQTPLQIRNGGPSSPSARDEAVRSRIHELTRKMEL